MVNNLVLLVVYVLNLALAFLVLLKNHRRMVNRLFFIFVLCLSLWLFSFFLRSNFDTHKLLLHRLSFTGPYLFPSVFLLFSYYFPVKKKLSKTLFWVFLSIGLVFTGLSFYSISHIDSQGEAQSTIIATVIFPLYFVPFMFLAFYNLFHSYRISKSTRRLQIQYFLIGTLLMTLIASTTNLALPVIFGITRFSTLGPISTVLMFGFTAYAIVKHHLLDIRLVIKKSFVFSVLVLSIAGVYAMFVIYVGQYLSEVVGGGSDILVGFIAAALIVLFYEPFKHLLERITDSFLFRGDYHSHVFLAEIGAEIGSTLEVDNLVDVVSNGLEDVLRIRDYTIVIREPDCEDFFVMRTGGWNRSVWSDKRMVVSVSALFRDGVDSIDVDHLLGEIEEHGTLGVFEKLFRDQANVETLMKLKEHGVLFVFPMCVKKKVIGFFILGEKKSGAMYREKDINTLFSLSSQAAISLENAQLYQRLHQFNISLKHEVEVATEKLKSQNKELKRLDKAKSEFVSIASHQLRTPLTSIKGYVSMIIGGDYGQIPGGIHEPLQRVAISTNRLVSLVEDLLNLSRIEAGRIQYTFEDVNLGDLVQSVCRDMEQHAQSKKLVLSCDIPKQQITVRADATKLVQVFQNLIDNAVKYTRKGTITVKVGTNRRRAVVTVTDTGAGISKDDLSRIFQKFVRGKGTSLLHTNGTGIGLYVAKIILAEHKGTIEGSSEGEGRGSRFEVVLPLTKSKK